MSDIGFIPITNHQSPITSLQLSVVVPTYNQADLLRECLRSLVDQTLEPSAYEIVVVDDGSTDSTTAVLEEFRSRLVSIRLPTNRGRSAARNAGIERAKSLLIAFVDSDVVVRPDFLEWHLRTHRNGGPGLLSRGPVVVVQSAGEARNSKVPWVATSPAYLDTANAAVEKTALIRAGLFDEMFPGYGWEDFEIGLRLQQLGIRRAYCRQAVAFHIHTEDRWEAIEELLQKEEARARSAVYFYYKHPSLRTRLLIQATPLHRALYWLQAGGGLLTPENVAAATARMRKARWTAIAYLALRGVLNRHYTYALLSEFRRHAPVVA